MKPFLGDGYYEYKPMEYPDPDPPPTVAQRLRESGYLA